MRDHPSQLSARGRGERGHAGREPRAIDVLRMRDEIVTSERAMFKHFDLPATLGVTVKTR